MTITGVRTAKVEVPIARRIDTTGGWDRSQCVLIWIDDNAGSSGISHIWMVGAHNLGTYESAVHTLERHVVGKDIEAIDGRQANVDRLASEISRDGRVNRDRHYSPCAGAFTARRRHTRPTLAETLPPSGYPLRCGAGNPESCARPRRVQLTRPIGLGRPGASRSSAAGSALRCEDGPWTSAADASSRRGEPVGGVDAIIASAPATVLCVMTDRQYEEYREPLAAMCVLGVELIFEPSPEDALDQLEELDPGLLLLGVDMGAMEGFEFLALCARRYPALATDVVVLPDIGDPFPAILQTHDANTGHVTTTETNLSEVAARIGALAPKPQRPVSAAIPVARPRQPQPATGDRPTPRPQAVNTVLVLTNSGPLIARARQAVAVIDPTIRVEQCNVQQFATLAAILRPLAVVVSEGIFAFDAAEFEALCTAVGALLVVVPDSMNDTALRASIRDVCRRSVNGRN